MNKENRKGNIVFGIVLVIAIVMMTIILVVIYKEIHSDKLHYHDVSEDGVFSTSFIRESHEHMNQENYMVSPYSVEIALSLLREGSGGDTLKELESIVPKRSIKTLDVYKKVNVANGLFIKDIYKNDMKSSYVDLLSEEYNADVIYDSFQTPDKINRWAEKETNGMIKEVISNIDPKFVLGVANAVAMEEEWKIPFQCESTTGYAFTKVNGKQFDTAMMFQSYEEEVAYYSDELGEAVIIPYKIYDRKNGKEADEGEQLDFIGILPKKLDTYVEHFDLEVLKEITERNRYASDSLEITVGLPRFEFDYDFKNFKTTLMDMGIQRMFGVADFSNMIHNHDDLFVSEAVHKSYVKVDEAGTKAAAVTYFGTKDNAMPVEDEKEYISLIFDRPFVFIIKDHNSNEILFFGVVYEPEKWTGEKSCK